MAQLTIQDAFDLAVRHHQAGRLREAEQIYRQILAQQPEHAEALNHLGVIATQAGRHDLAVDLIRRAIALRPNYVQALNNLGSVLKEKGQLDDAIAACRQAIALKPDLCEAYNNLGTALKDKGQIDDAIAAFRRAIALRPSLFEAYLNLGNALLGKRQLDDAITACRQAIALRPDSFEAHNNLGNALRDNGQLDDAIAALRQAIALRPNYADVYYNLGNALNDKRQFADAIAAYRQAIALRPNFREALNNLGNALKDTDQLDDAIAVYRQAIALGPDWFEAYNNLGNALKDKGQLDDAIAAYRQAVALKPSYAQAYSNLVYTLYFHPGYTARQILEASRAWAQAHEGPLAKQILPHPNDPTPNRRLRIGYVSPDFREHCQSFFMLPLLEHHDHKALEIFCYAGVGRPDDFTRRIMGCADAWRQTHGQSDEELAERIRADRIDVLVDLTLHMADNRLLLFCRKPAPVQVAWLGYPGTTGLSAMDWRLSDPHLDPPGNGDALYSETTLRLPETFWCYDPLTVEPEVNKLPALTNGQVTFGCLNNFCKVQPTTLRLWARVLAQVSGSRLLLLCPEGEHRPALRAEFAGMGIAPERVELVAFQPRAQYLRTYHRIDLGLDTLPANGHTTSLDAMWMGVPVITRVGTTALGRAGFSQLSNLGLTELVAWNDDDFVRLAADWARDLPRLAELRSTLRCRMQGSPLMDGPRFAAGMEAAYRLMWGHWCKGKS